MKKSAMDRDTHGCLTVERRVEERVMIETPGGEQMLVTVTGLSGLSGGIPRVKLTFHAPRPWRVARVERQPSAA